MNTPMSDIDFSNKSIDYANGFVDGAITMLRESQGYQDGLIEIMNNAKQVLGEQK